MVGIHDGPVSFHERNGVAQLVTAGCAADDEVGDVVEAHLDHFAQPPVSAVGMWPVTVMPAACASSMTACTVGRSSSV